MITILHGEDIAKSRKSLDDLKVKEKNREIITLESQKASLTDLKQALETQSLFGQERLVILENFLTLKKKSKESQQILDYLKGEEHKGDLIFWEGQEVGRLNLGAFPQAKVLLFKLDPIIFRFLDGVSPDNAQKMIELFRQVSRREEVNLIFYLLIRQFRLLLALRDNDGADFEEVKRLADWQKSKLRKQAQYFSRQKILEIYRGLLKIDFQEKTGNASYPLPQTLELFLATL